jgi:predicted DNA-binding transcriptional regulator YafY
VARQRLYVDVTGWRPSEENISCLPALQQAIWRERKLELTYQRTDGVTVERLVDPLGLVAKGRIWYFIATTEGSSPTETGEVRTYRVSRVQAARLTDRPCVRPKDFNLAAYWEDSKADFVANLPRYPVLVRVDPAILPRLHSAGHFVRVERVGLPDIEGWIEVCLRFEIEAEACGYILGFGPQIEVVEPGALREKVIHLAEGALELYKRRKPSHRPGFISGVEAEPVKKLLPAPAGPERLPENSPVGSHLQSRRQGPG